MKWIRRKSQNMHTHYLSTWSCKVTVRSWSRTLLPHSASMYNITCYLGNTLTLVKRLLMFLPLHYRVSRISFHFHGWSCEERWGMHDTNVWNDQGGIYTKKGIRSKSVNFLERRRWGVGGAIPSDWWVNKLNRNILCRNIFADFMSAPCIRLQPSCFSGCG